ncbi:MAG: T9SS type A sorting domain-containing protein [Crocinitomicaceae bacterium]|nr:T9SS type A sorting domain-containing protein [Crocinitomicaceae bacterium]
MHKLFLIGSYLFVLNTFSQTWLTVGSPAFTSGLINCACEYNGKLVVCGSFSEAGGVPCTSIAAWDGSVWSNDFGYPLTSAPVNACCVFQNELYIAGNFSTIDGIPCKGIAKYDGTNWSPVGNGPFDDTQNYIYDMIVYHDELILFGYYSKIGDVSRSCISSYDGTQFNSLSNGVFLTGWSNRHKLEIYNDKLYVSSPVLGSADGSLVNSIACWDGVSWSDVGNYPGGGVFDTENYDSLLIMVNTNTGYLFTWNEISHSTISLGSIDMGVYTTLEKYGNYLLVSSGSKDYAYYNSTWMDISFPMAENDFIVYNGKLYKYGSAGMTGYNIAVLNTGLPASIEQFEKDSVSLFPIPAESLINICSPIEIKRIYLTTLDGKKMLDLTSESGLTEINVEGLSTGEYVVSIYFNNETHITRLIYKK